MKQFMEKYVKGMMIFSMGIMVLGLALFFVDFSIKQDQTGDSFMFTDETDIQLEDEGVPMGFWKGDLEEEAEAEQIIPYTDIIDHWAKHYIMTIIDKEVMSPITETTFEPNRKVTRAEFISIPGKTENIDKQGRTVKTFTDVAHESIYAPYIAWAEQNGMCANSSNNKFRPDDLLTREEMAVMLCKYLENVRGEILTMGLNFRDDEAISAWAKDDVMLVTGTEYLSGRTNGNFDPKGNVTRAETATTIVRLIERLDL